MDHTAALAYGARYNPSTGTYARGAFAYGPYGARGAAQAYNPRTGTYAQTRQGSGVYGSWGSTQVQRGDNWASTKRFTNSAGNTTRVTRGCTGRSDLSARTGGRRLCRVKGRQCLCGTEMEMFTSRDQVVTGRNGTTVVGIRVTDQRKTMLHETAC